MFGHGHSSFSAINWLGSEKRDFCGADCTVRAGRRVAVISGPGAGRLAGNCCPANSASTNRPVDGGDDGLPVAAAAGCDRLRSRRRFCRRRKALRAFAQPAAAATGPRVSGAFWLARLLLYSPDTSVARTSQ
ncbi:hypothetical protein C4K05_3491 [Pseudomonas chlororaphis subsp. aureofaciens]|uniref:Uncharacterized protein n=1 Tax=Pseudomonas chlororaphis subsp. aureofaciens TaxID=587851 RepID=A0AAD0ZJB7_9PSED|nr:hypothetical protein C4K08_3498 [Pseudomonas chlororaphis subsp. aureofaciens]AZE30189.1 hypothetical protein C4K07_3404 [Pseudomonas chlororaphis subsp. aureofaciens]AZE36483.1 hypothetical protein C4K06_3450 [Pseudomonas chlororaphis subsp. aureofaciens]AZE42831.1 hypothetical protein C4K05_3491 [Pseudomonas chlororaphis subsp. aureofaciens]